MTRLRWISAGVVAASALASSIAVTQTSCGQTPTNVPVRTFERAGRMDILCMQVLSIDSTNGGLTPIPAIPVSEDHCSPVATGVDTTTLPYHLIAVVTQTLRGELAVVDLTLGRVVDTSLALPGTNFLPVGQNPTDVVVTPDAQKVFVTAAETNKPAIYEIPSTKLLGDSEILDEPGQAAEQLALPSWPACGLPQAPGRMVVVPTGSTTNAEGGVTPSYEIVVVMPGNGNDLPALAGVIDTAAFDSIPPGSLQPCPLKSVIHLAENSSALPTSWQRGQSWGLGIPYTTSTFDGSVDLFTSAAPSGNTVQPSTNYALPLFMCPGLAHGTTAPTDAGTTEGGTNAVPDASPLKLTPGAKVHGSGMASDGRFVWIADDEMPFIHVLDTQTPGTLTELAPLVATSIVEPSRVVTTSDLSISPVTRDFKRYLYAVDALQGGIMVYDVTDPANGPRTPLTRPNPELDPNQAPDRILFNAPVSTVTFARHDFPVPGVTGPAQTGLLCNPNPNVTVDDGSEYRANGIISVPLGPKRLRGVFAFATLTSGQVVAIDVDDWDSPCRRPIMLTSTTQTGALAIPQLDPSGPGDLDPYHTPNAISAFASDSGVLQSVTVETMWPLVQPHRIRSVNFITNDLTGANGLHDPSLTTAPTLLINGAPVALAGNSYATLTAALPEFSTVTPASPLVPPNVYMAHDVPDVHIDQTWNVVYEGIIPGFDGVAATITTDDQYATMRFSHPTAAFCGHGVEDHRLGLERFAAMQVDDTALSAANKLQSMIPVTFDQRVGDYVQISDDILGAADAGPGIPLDDGYWKEHNPNDCWSGIGGTVDLSKDLDDATGLARQQVCIDKFGAYGADQNPQRDFPILEAYEDHLVLGRYAYLDPTNRPTNGRVIVPRDTSTQVDFKLAQCCFHNQAHFRIRAGSEWVALGANNLYLHHIVHDSTNACVQGCDPNTILLNSRVPELAIPSPNTQLNSVPNRNSPFALRNPAFSFYLPAPVITGPNAKTSFSVSQRDDAWQFTTTGQYGWQGVSLTAATTSVVPQSSMFIGPLGAIAVVDGSAEGLFIIDLNTLTIADGSPFF